MTMRREIIALLAGAAATPIMPWPRVSRAQQSMPVIGFLDSRSQDALTDRVRHFRQGMKEIGYVEGENVAIEYRWAEGQFDRLRALAAELVRRQVAVIVASGGPAVASTAKAATATIPTVFIVAEDPVRLGLVASLARPGGNLTGINFYSQELVAKRLGLLHELVPAAKRVAVLVNSDNARNTEITVKDAETAARASGLQIQVVNARTSAEIDEAFAALARERPDALFVGGDAFLDSRRLQLSLQAMRLGIPAAYSGREYAEAGGLMSYGSDVRDAYRQIGVYAARILKSAKPADLPVIQASKLELVINHQTARILGLPVPATLLARTDEVIE